MSKANLAISGLVAVGTNLYEYGMGEHREDGVGSQEFWVSTGIDFGTSLGIGVGSALAVAGASALVVLFGGTAVVGAPLILAAAGLGLVGSIVLEVSGVQDTWKAGMNEFVDEREEEIERLESAPEQRVAPRSGLPIE